MAPEGAQEEGAGPAEADPALEQFFVKSRELFMIADHERRVRRVNPAWERFLGYSADELIGRSYLDFVHGDDREATVGRAEGLRRGEDWVEGFENRYVCRDGSVRWLRWSSAYGREEGLVYAMATDVTDVKRAEEARRRSRRLYARGEELVGLASFELDFARETWRWSPGVFRLTGLDPDDFDDSYDFTLSFIYPEDRARVDDAIERMRRGEQIHLRYRYVRVDGEVRSAETVAGHEPDGRGGPGCAAGVLVDITDRLASEEEARRREAERQQGQRLETVGRLAGGIAHDFNNLLSVIINNATLALGDLPAGSSAHGELEEVGQAARRAAELTHQLVLFSRQEMVEPEVLDVNAVLRRAERLLRRTLGEDVALELRLDEGLPAVRVDAAQLERAIVNLAVNARDAMPSGGRLEIVTETDEEGGACVRVVDDGRGMDDEVAARAFEPFFTTKAPGEGSGLGLATVHGVVSQAGGEVSLSSAPGAGTAVTVRLPAAEEETAGPSDDSGANDNGAGHDGASVLVVEDEPSVRRLITRLLEPEGYSVIDAAGPTAALEAREAADERIDLLLTDVVMPEMSGHELAERLRESQPDLAVLFMSGYTDDVVARHVVPDLTVRFVPKPFTRESLLGAVREALAARTGAVR